MCRRRLHEKFKNEKNSNIQKAGGVKGVTAVAIRGGLGEQEFIGKYQHVRLFLF